MSKHTIVMSDIQCLVTLDALRMLIENKDKHKDDKRIAQEVRYTITEIVSNDKHEKIKEQRMNILVDYMVADQCENQDAWYTCYKCGKCGRKFDNGYMVDDGGTTVTDEVAEE